MYKGVKWRKKEKWQDVKLAQCCYENLCMSIIDHLWKVGHIYMQKIDSLQ
jgi:hypothetical protein